MSVSKLDFGNGYNSENSVAIVWAIEDVRYQLEILNENYDIELVLCDDDCMQVLERVADNHDANYGVNWDSIYNAIEWCFEDEIREKREENNE